MLTCRERERERFLCPPPLPQLLVMGTVFARMSPDQKGQLVAALQDVGWVLGKGLHTIPH